MQTIRYRVIRTVLYATASAKKNEDNNIVKNSRVRVNMNNNIIARSDNKEMFRTLECSRNADSLNEFNSTYILI